MCINRQSTNELPTLTIPCLGSTKRATTAAHCSAVLCSVLYHAFLHYQVSDSTVITHNGVSGPLHTLPEFKRRLKTIIEVQ